MAKQSDQMIRFTQRVTWRSALHRVLRRLCGNERGNISIITAFAMPVLLGFGALGVDVSVWLKAKNSVQGAADATVVSLAAAVKAGDSPTRWQTEAYATAAANGYTNGQNGVVVAVNNPPVSPSAFAGNVDAYEVAISQPQKLYLAQVFGAKFGLLPPTVTSRAVALVKRNSPTCLLALDNANPPPPNGTLNTSGVAIMKSVKCAIYDDSTGSKSINTAGGGSITASYIGTMGNYYGSLTVTDPPYTVKTSGQYVADPYRYTRSIPPIPIYQPSSANNWSGSTPPGGMPGGGVVAYNGDVRVSGNTTLAPGVYIITGNLKSSKLISGTGVTIILTSRTPSTDSSNFDFSGGGMVNLTAPPTGPTAGIALWADRNLGNRCDQGSNCGTDQLTGGGTSTVVGAVYLPTHAVKYAGNQQAVSTSCNQIIAWDITVTGTPTFYHQCAGVGILDPVLTWGLVE
jgi:Flp pilus assembly protein TadG